MEKRRVVLAALTVLALASCASFSPRYAVECASPEQTSAFRYADFNKYRVVKPSTLELTSNNNVVYYNIPEGTACRVQPLENASFYEQEEHPDVHRNLHTESGEPGSAYRL